MPDSTLSPDARTLADLAPPDAPNGDDWQFRPYALPQAREDAAHIGAGLTTGFAGLDAMDFRFRAGKLYMVAARQGEGKTAMLLELLRFRASNLHPTQGPAVFVTYEETLLSVYTRLLLQQAGVFAELRKEEPPTIPLSFVEDWLRGKAHYSADAQLWTATLDDAAVMVDNLTAKGHLALVDGDGERGRVDDLARWLRIASGKLGRVPSLVLLDYAQKIRPPLQYAGAPRQQQLQQVSDYLRRYAKGETFEGIPPGDPVPVVVGAQVNREATNDDGTGVQPELHHIRECDDFANDAAGILTMFRPDEGRISVKVVKNRDGSRRGEPIGLAFHGPTRHIYEGNGSRSRQPGRPQDMVLE